MRIWFQRVSFFFSFFFQCKMYFYILSFVYLFASIILRNQCQQSDIVFLREGNAKRHLWLLKPANRRKRLC